MIKNDLQTCQNLRFIRLLVILGQKFVYFGVKKSHKITIYTPIGDFVQKKRQKFVYFGAKKVTKSRKFALFGDFVQKSDHFIDFYSLYEVFKRKNSKIGSTKHRTYVL